MTTNHTNNILEIALTQLKKQKNCDYELSLNVEQGISTTVRMANIEALQQHRNQSLSVSIYRGKKKGYASGVDLSNEGIKKTIEAANLISQYSADDPFVGLAPKDKMAWQVPDLDLYHPWSVSAQTGIDLASSCEQHALDCAQITNSEGTEFTSVENSHYYANSTGLLAKQKETEHSLYCRVIASNKNEMQSAYAYSCALDKNDLLATKTIGQHAAKQAKNKLNAKLPQSKQYPVIFAAEIASGLFASFFNAISGNAQYNKKTFLLNKLGQQIFPKWLSIEERPHTAKTIGACGYDADGAATWQKHFIKAGVLEYYLLGQYGANQLKRASTANAGGIHHCLVSHQNDNQKSLLKQMHRGILITELMGQGIDITTGNYSRGASGFWVDNGKIVHALSNFTIAGNLSEMFQGIVAIGSDIEQRKTLKTGSVLIESMAVAGQ